MGGEFEVGTLNAPNSVTKSFVYWVWREYRREDTCLA